MNDVPDCAIQQVAAWLRRHTVEGVGNVSPKDILESAISVLPLSLYRLRGLTLNRVRQCLAPFVDSDSHLPFGEDRLHGYCFALRGHGRLFLDSSDTRDEQRFTLAHELAHFLLDYYLPREYVLSSLGPAIRAALDGNRPLSAVESLHFQLRNVPIGSWHWQSQSHIGQTDASISDAVEDRADALALELLAPWDELIAAVGKADRRDRGTLEATAWTMLTGHFALPALAAARYAHRFAAEIWREPSLRDRLLPSQE